MLAQQLRLAHEEVVGAQSLKALVQSGQVRMRLLDGRAELGETLAPPWR